MTEGESHEGDATSLSYSVRCQPLKIFAHCHTRATIEPEYPDGSRRYIVFGLPRKKLDLLPLDPRIKSEGDRVEVIKLDCFVPIELRVARDMKTTM